MTSSKVANISDDAVKNATGRAWSQWLKLIDKAGGMSMPHKDIARMLKSKHALSGWWSQMITVGYERARGKRKKHQTAQGYQISATKTFAVPVAELYRAWTDDRTRAKCLGKQSAKLQVRKTVPRKHVRMTWPDGQARVDVVFDARGKGKSRVGVEQSKIADHKTALRLKAFWRKVLERLKASIEA